MEYELEVIGIRKHPPLVSFWKHGKLVNPQEVGMILSPETMAVYVHNGFVASFGPWGDVVFPLDENGKVIDSERMHYSSKMG